MSEQFIKELKWKYPFFLHLEELLNIANKIPLWNTSQYCSISSHNLKKIDVFNKIDNCLQQHNVYLFQGILRKFKPLSSIGIHTDHAVLCTSLNIPLLNPQSAITRWYDFTSDEALRSEQSIATLIQPSSPFRSHFANYLKFKIFEFRMSSPVLFNTSIHHNVEVTDNVERIIISLQFKKGQGQHLKWEDNWIFDSIDL